MQVNEPQASESDVEQLELYLDHELSEGDARHLDGRLATEPSLASALEQLRGQRSLRLNAMTTAYESDADSIERLVASVRIAQVNESMQRRRSFLFAPQMRSVFAAAACVAFGLLLGVTLQNRHSGANGLIAAPAAQSTGSFLSSDGNLTAHGAYAVSVSGTDGREMMKVRFSTQEQAQQFIQRINNRAANAPAVHVGDAKILDEPY
jgi:hypothetical protein